MNEIQVAILESREKARERTRESGIDVEIHLKPSGMFNRSLPNNIQEVIKQEYATRYLDELGVRCSRIYICCCFISCRIITILTS